MLFLCMQLGNAWPRQAEPARPVRTKQAKRDFLIGNAPNSFGSRESNRFTTCISQVRALEKCMGMASLRALAMYMARPAGTTPEKRPDPGPEGHTRPTRPISYRKR